MILDSIEMIMRTEEIFVVSFDDSELVEVRTVGEYFQLILSKLTPVNSSVCLTSHTFYRIRKEIMNKFGSSRNSLTPITRLDTIIPKKSRILHWKSLQESLNLKLPDLKRPKWMEVLFGFSFFLMFAIGIVLRVSGLIQSLTACIVIFLAIPLLVVEYKMTEKCKIEFPELSDYMGKLTSMVLMLNFSTIQKEIKSWNEKEVYDALILQLVDQLGIVADKINLNSRIVDDLGIH